MDAFLRALSIIVPLFAILSMAGAGLGQTMAEVGRLVRHPAAVLAALFGNFVLVPLLALALIRVLALQPAHAIGLFLLSTAAGSAFMLALVRIARVNPAPATRLLVALLLVTIVYMPLVIPAVLPWAEVSALAIARPLLLTMLLPLGAGLAVNARAPRLAAKLVPLFGKLSSLALVLLIAATFKLNLPSLVGMLGSGALLAAFLLTLGSFVIGYALAGNRPERRAALGLGSAQRNVAAAMVVAARAFDEPEPLVMIVVSSLVAFTVLFPAAYWLRRKAGRRTPRGLEPIHPHPFGDAGSGSPA